MSATGPRPWPCLACGYPRAGLGTESACPECGAPPPPLDTLALLGRSLPFSPWVPLVGSSLFLAFVVGIQIPRIVRSGWIPWDAPLLIMIALVVAVVVSARMLRRTRKRGGDVVWLVRPDAIEVRAAHGISTLQYGNLDRCESRVWPSRRLAKITIVPRNAWGFATSSIWLDRSTFDVERVANDLTQRILAARAP
ncbi:MAG: hypothetical protein JNM94_06515 [Phycisphaerae bacterium]|nr:hypothetical protein [Phycisphaerae bacterium]